MIPKRTEIPYKAGVNSREYISFDIIIKVSDHLLHYLWDNNNIATFALYFPFVIMQSPWQLHSFYCVNMCTISFERLHPCRTTWTPQCEWGDCRTNLFVQFDTGECHIHALELKILNQQLQNRMCRKKPKWINNWIFVHFWLLKMFSLT